MTLVAPDEGEVLLLKYLVNFTPATNPVLHLYENNLTPDDDTCVGCGPPDEVTEATAAGYAAITLTGTNFTIATSGGITTAEYADVTFTFTTNATIYGYYVTNTSETAVLWVERFSGAPFSLPTGGGTIQITPKVSLD